MRSVVKRGLAYMGGALVAVGVAIGAYAGTLIYTGNFGTVVEGQLYRSAQPTAAEINRDVARFGVKTIINLRGANPGTKWYDTEVRTAQALGLRHIDFRMSSRRELSQAQVQELIDIMANAPKPILIHCASGADRTGLAAAIYVASIAKQGEEKSEWQLSLSYGHISLPFMPQYAMDMTFEKLEPYFGFGNS